MVLGFWGKAGETWECFDEKLEFKQACLLQLSLLVHKYFMSLLLSQENGSSAALADAYHENKHDAEQENVWEFSMQSEIILKGVF